MKVCGKDINVRGRLIRIAEIDGDKYNFPDDPEGKTKLLGASSKHHTLASLPLRNLWRTNHNRDLSTQACHRLLMGPQPFFKYNETEKNLMIVVPPRRMLLEQFAHSLRAKVLIDPGTTIEQRIGHLAVDRSPEPIIHYVARKTPFRPLYNRFR